MKSNLAQKIEQDNEIHIHPSTLKKLERQAMSKKEEGHTRLPNTLIDDQIMAQLKDKAFKCLMFIVRQTIGFNRQSHTIAISQFQKYCGIKKRDTVMSSIGELEDANLIMVIRKTGCLNEYFLTLDQYQQSGLVPPMDSSPNKQDGTSTFNGDGTSTVKRDTIKETFKENIKEREEEEVRTNFQAQNRTLNFIEYHTQDRVLISFKNLCQKYSVEQDFIAQAKVSFPNHTEQQIQKVLSDLAQWSLSASNHTPQKWMSIWLDFMKREPSAQEKRSAESKKYQPKPKVQQVPLIGSNKRKAERTVNTFDAMGVIDV